MLLALAIRNFEAFGPPAVLDPLIVEPPEPSVLAKTRRPPCPTQEDERAKNG
jgi:hypothetical protein